jgi:hypothetical protein
MDHMKTLADDLIALMTKHQVSSVLIVIPLQDDFMLMASEINSKQMRQIAASLLSMTPPSNAAVN